VDRCPEHPEHAGGGGDVRDPAGGDQAGVAFQDRHENKDAYDLVFTLLKHDEGHARGEGRLRIARSRDTLR
jgi:hypothetical protein